MATKIKCPQCDSSAFAATVARYIWKTGSKYDIIDGYISIINANIFRCGNCGEGPVDESELKKWKTLAYKQEISEQGTDELQCGVCGLPQSMTGQFFSEGWIPNQKHYCKECYDKSQS